MEGARHSVELLEFVRREWDRFVLTKRRTMRELVIPAHIKYVLVDGELYEFLNPKCRKVWFEKDGEAYAANRFIVSEATNMSGHCFQLKLDRSAGDCYDDLQLIAARRLYVQQVRNVPLTRGPLVRG